VVGWTQRVFKGFKESHFILKNCECDPNGRLKEPLVVNAISVSNQRFNFLTYQLNTLNLKNNEGIKNLAFYDGGNEIYLNRPTVEKLPYPSHRNIQRLALRHLQYNPDVFKKFLAIMAFNSSFDTTITTATTTTTKTTTPK
jgi:hypothetical protein